MYVYNQVTSGFSLLSLQSNFSFFFCKDLNAKIKLTLHTPLHQVFQQSPSLQQMVQIQPFNTNFEMY